MIAIDIDPVKLELAQRVGATHVVDAGRTTSSTGSSSSPTVVCRG